jgi:hypothetical protein
MLENTEGVIKRMDTQDTGQIHVREYRRGPVFLDCPFALPLWYSLTFICPVSCVPCVASFSGLSLFITPSVFSNNPEKLASLGTQDTEQIHVREYRRGIKKKTIQRNWENMVHKTQDK